MDHRRIVAALITMATELDTEGYGEIANVIDAVSERIAQIAEDAPMGQDSTAQDEVLMPEATEEDASRPRHQDVDMFLKHLRDSGAEVIG